MTENAKKIQKVMDDDNLYGEIIEDSGDTVKVEVLWGDWKHSHLRLKWLVQDKVGGVKDYYSETTDDDGTDCYSAIHTFIFD